MIKSTTKFSLILFIILIVAVDAAAQIDSLNTKHREGYYHALRVGFGTEGTQYAEVGYARMILHERGANSFSTSYTFYGGAQINFPGSGESDQYIYGAKAGFENTIYWAVIWGAEIRYLTTRDHDWQLYFTPKIGLTKSNIASIVYGINLPEQDNLEQVSRHQFSLTVNLSKRLFRDYFK
ncbi:MAG TPA: hypothetical protein VGK39_03125 [Cyclobacteriaceae bacterium]